MHVLSTSSTHTPKTIPGRLFTPYSPEKIVGILLVKKETAQDATLEKNYKGRSGKEQGKHTETNGNLCNLEEMFYF